jgi:hypothetical protein
MGCMLMNGFDDAEAVMWFSLAADQGDESALDILEYTYIDLISIGKD